MIFKSWTIAPPDTLRQREFSDFLGIHPITAQIIINRGVLTSEDAREHLNPALKSLPDPYLLPDMEAAVSRIEHAIERSERITVFGDYDVDGITSSALVYRFFKALGIEIGVHIPNRLTEGYGLNVESLEKLRKEGTDLLITVDNGTRSLSEVAIANEMGLDVVVTDHHEAESGLPDAVAVVNPKREDSAYPDRDLAGCGVAFTLLMALRKRLREKGLFSSAEPNLREYLDLVAIGTIADIVPLKGVNRTMTKYGMEAIRTSPRPGIEALIKISGLNDPRRGLSAGQVAFRIAPRLNAAGRMGDALPAFRCLVTEDKNEAENLAQQLDRANGERQRIEEKILREARAELDEGQVNPLSAALVFSSHRWHPGVVGIVASKLAETTSKPCAVIACEGGVGKGSVRSAGGVNVVDALAKTSDLIDRYGGHEQAAGFTVDVRKIEEFRKRFASACALLESDGKESILLVDAKINADIIDDKLVDELGYLEPYGIGNMEPILCSNDFDIIDKSIVGGSHLRLRLDSGTSQFQAIGFGMANIIDSIDSKPMIAFVPQYNIYNGFKSIQLKLKGILVE